MLWHGLSKDVWNTNHVSEVTFIHYEAANSAGDEGIYDDLRDSSDKREAVVSNEKL